MFKIIEHVRADYQIIKDTIEKYYYGIKTGYNEAFIINSETKKELITKHSSSEQMIKPFLEGKDLKKWHSHDAEKFLIFTKRGIDIVKYPAIERDISQF